MQTSTTLALRATQKQATLARIASLELRKALTNVAMAERMLNCSYNIQAWDYQANV